VLDIEKSSLDFFGSSKKIKKHIVKNKNTSPSKSIGFKNSFEFEELKLLKSLDESNSDSELDSQGDVSSDDGHYIDLPIIIETNSEKYDDINED
jgi:hypothetical protein